MAALIDGWWERSDKILVLLDQPTVMKFNVFIVVENPDFLPMTTAAASNIFFPNDCVLLETRVLASFLMVPA